MSAWRATAAAGFVFAYEAAILIHGGDRKRALLDGSVQRARAEYLLAWRQGMAYESPTVRAYHAMKFREEMSRAMV